MSSSKKRSALQDAVLAQLEEIRSKNYLLDEDLDLLLLRLDPEAFEDQLDTLIAELGTVPLTAGTSPVPAEVKKPSLPSSGRVSRRYLHDIDKFQVMDREVETLFARRMEFVTARLEAAEYQTREERRLRRAEFERIREEFVERNLHLVVSHAYAYRTYNVPMDDLIQEGNASLIRACEKFDWRHEVRFKTYVAYWIRQAIERHLASVKGAVRVPHHLQQKFRRLKREGKLPRHSDHDLSVDQVAEAFEVNRDAAGHLLEASRPSFSIDQEVTSEGDSYRDFLWEDWEPSDSEQLGRLKERLSDLMHDLDDREKTVLNMRFGLEGREVATLEQVGQCLALSRERSRQIQQRALGKLRRAAEEARLKDYL